MRILFALPGFHRVHRGAEVALESIAREIALLPGHEVTLVGSGTREESCPYRFRQASAIPPEHFEGWPRLPFLRNEYAYEDLTFALPLLREHWSRETDVTVTCSYPYTSWVLRSHPPGRRRVPHVFVTQNGDWPASARQRECRFFSCDGLVCTNPIYLHRNQERWFSELIPNGMDPARFHPAPGDRKAFGLPKDRPVVLMVSALAETKRVLEGMRAVARIPEAFLVVAGDGPLRQEADRLATELLPGRFRRMTLPRERMPDLYRTADVFLHMAIRESFGNVFVEALACGIPVVAHDDEVTRWIFEGHAHLVDTRAEDALQEALTAVLRSQGRGSAGQVGFAASRYSWNAIALRYHDFLTAVLRRTSDTG